MANLTLASAEFEPGGSIPVDCTCDGADRSPRLRWDGVPDGTESFVLVVDDPGTSEGLFTHWVVYDIPKKIREIGAFIRHAESVGGGEQGMNSFGNLGWNGPCPSGGDDPHQFYFRLYALDCCLNLAPGADRRAVMDAMQGHVLDNTELIGTYGRQLVAPIS